MKTKSDRLFNAFSYLSHLVVMVLILTAVVLIAHVTQSNYDSKTRIENAQVIAKDQTSGTRRSTPVHYLMVQELGKDSATKVTPRLGAWYNCEVGYLYTDLPGVEGKCSNPDKPKLLELENIEMFTYKPIAIEP